MRLKILAVAVIVAAPALAQEAPDLVGAWKPTEDVSARVGENAGVIGPVAAPTLNAAATGWSIRIDKQDGRAFHGVSVAPNGQEQTLVGVFGRDGATFHVSTRTGMGVGEMLDGGGFELCWTDAVADYVAAACTSYAR